MKTYEFTFWVKTPSDSRDTASSVGSFKIEANSLTEAFGLWSKASKNYLKAKYGAENVGIGKYRVAGWGRTIKLIGGVKNWSKEF